MTSKIKILFTLFSVSLIILICGKGWAEVGVTERSILVGCSNSFSGPLAFTGTELVKYGIEIYFNHINERGGIHGRKLIHKSYDDGYDPTKAVANTKRLVEEDKVFCILSPKEPLLSLQPLTTWNSRKSL